MRKTLTIILLILNMLLFHFLQHTIFQKFMMFNIFANIIIIYFIFMATYTNKVYSYILAIIYGFIVDIKFSNPIGTTAFALIILIEVSIRLSSLLYINSRIATMLKIFFITIIFELSRYILRAVILVFDIEIIEFLKIVAIQAIYNMLILMVIYPAFKYIGEVTDQTLHKSNILTKHF